MDPQFSSNVYNFTKQMMDALVKNFEGKEIGTDDANPEVFMKFFFEDYTPGDIVEVEEDETSSKKKTKKEKKAKKKGPKRATTAFFYYVADIRAQVKEENEGLQVSELSKIHGKMWRELPEDKKEPYLEKNKKDILFDYYAYCEMVSMFFIFIILQLLARKLYYVLWLAWLNMLFKLEGVGQTMNMLRTCRPEGYPEKDPWPPIPPKIEYEFIESEDQF